MVTKDEIIQAVKGLGLPENNYVVFGSAPLAAAGLREANDIDLLVSKQVHDRLRQDGWQEMVKGPDDKPLVHDVFEAHAHWNFSAYKPTLAQLLSRAVIIDDVPFASLEDVRKWKAELARPKDAKDLELIDAYLKTH